MYLHPDMQNMPHHSRILLRWITQAETALWEKEPPVPVAYSAREKLSALLFDRLYAVAEPALSALLQERLSRDNPIAALNMDLIPRNEREEASSALLEELEDSNLAPLQGMPVLLEWLKCSAAQFTQMILEMLARIDDHHQAIAQAFFGCTDLGEIIDVSCDGGDLHEDGRCAVIVTTTRGKLLYKPHDCRTDVLYAQLVDRHFSDITRAPCCVAGDGYGFCEFIHARSAKAEEEIRQYFRHFGSLCALFQALGSSDLHAENFLAIGDLPVLIDFETLLTPSPKVFGETLLPDQHGSFTDALNHSLYPSSLLPSLSGGRDLSPLMNKESAGRGLPVLSGAVQTVQDHMDDFLSGFEEGYRRCMALRSELESVLQAFSAIRVRRLLRHTRYYAALQRRLLAPRALASSDAQRAVTEGLRSYFEQAHAPHLFPIAAAEEAALLRGDIPYFYAMGDSCDLLSSGQVVVKGYFACSGVENARRRLARMSEGEMRFEKELLVSAIRLAIVPLPNEEHRTFSAKQNSAMQTQEQFYAEAEKVMKRICSFALKAPNGAIGWLTNVEGRTSTMQPELMQGIAGLGIFLSACAASGMREATPYAEACLEHLERYTFSLEQGNPLQFKRMPLGLNGAAGILRSLRLIQTHMPQAQALYAHFLALIPRMEIEHAGPDVISGVSGLLSELCFSPLSPDHALIRRCADRLLRTKTLVQPDGVLLWDTLGKKRIISGAGHGMAGIGAALIHAYDAIADDRWLAAANDAFVWESHIYNEKLATWPDLRLPGSSTAMHGYCSGAPGIGLMLLSCMRQRSQIADWDANMDRAIGACLHHPIRFRDHLCCGNSADADFLLEAGRRLEREELTHDARRMLCEMSQRAQDDYSYLPSGYQASFTPTLFYGAAGVGYTLLRAADTAFASVLV